MEIKSTDFSVVIMSCDSYEDVWSSMTQSIENFWPDCPFPIYLCSEEKDFNHPTIRNIKTGQAMGWSEMLIYVLNQITTKHVIYLQEDYILKGPTQTQIIIDYLEFFVNNNAAYFRLVPYPPPKQIVNESLNVGLINHGEDYRTSLQAAAWDKKVLLDLLVPTENGWQFERNSVSRSDKIERPFYTVGLNSEVPNKNLHSYPLDYYSTAVLQGKWQKEGVKILRQAGIMINTETRGCLTRWDFFYYHKKKTAKGWVLKILTALDHYIFNRKTSQRKF